MAKLLDFLNERTDHSVMFPQEVELAKALPLADLIAAIRALAAARARKLKGGAT